MWLSHYTKARRYLSCTKRVFKFCVCVPVRILVSAFHLSMATPGWCQPVCARRVAALGSKPGCGGALVGAQLLFAGPWASFAARGCARPSGRSGTAARPTCEPGHLRARRRSLRLPPLSAPSWKICADSGRIRLACFWPILLPRRARQLVERARLPSSHHAALLPGKPLARASRIWPR